MANNPIWNPVNRRNSREWAVQLLFLLDANPPQHGLDKAIAEYWGMQVRNYEDRLADKRSIIDNLPPDENSEIPQFPETPYSEKLEAAAPVFYRNFAESLVRGVWNNLDQIDTKIEAYLQNWTLARIGGVDRAVLRMAIYELFFSEETPPVVIVNEAVDVAKYFSTRDSGRFVNGILDRAIKDVKRPAREAVKKPRAKKQIKPMA